MAVTEENDEGSSMHRTVYYMSNNCPIPLPQHCLFTHRLVSLRAHPPAHLWWRIVVRVEMVRAQTAIDEAHELTGIHMTEENDEAVLYSLSSTVIIFSSASSHAPCFFSSPGISR
jgi:hypothetical protein